MDVKKLKSRSLKISIQNDSLNKELRDYFIGKSVEIVCPRYNGQIYGCSKKPLMGKVFSIDDVHMEKGQIWFYNNDLDAPISEPKVKLI